VSKRPNGKRPDVVTLIPWFKGRSLLWDFTCTNTLAPSHITKTSKAVESAAMEAEVPKSTKYAELMPAHEFCPFAVETLGTWGPEVQALVPEIGKRISELTGEPRSASFLR